MQLVVYAAHYVFRYMGALRQLVSKAALQGDVSMVANPYRHISTMIDVKFITC